MYSVSAVFAFCRDIVLRLQMLFFFKFVCIMFWVPAQRIHVFTFNLSSYSKLTHISGFIWTSRPFIFYTFNKLLIYLDIDAIRVLMILAFYFGVFFVAFHRLSSLFTICNNLCFLFFPICLFFYGLHITSVVTLKWNRPQKLHRKTWTYFLYISFYYFVRFQKHVLHT